MPFMSIEAAERKREMEIAARKSPVPKPFFLFYSDEPFEYYLKHGSNESERNDYYRDLWGYSMFNRPLTLVYWRRVFCGARSTQDMLPQSLRRLIRP